MLQNVNAPGPAGWPTSIANPVLNQPGLGQRNIRRSSNAEIRPPVSDFALMHPEAVVASSDVFAWHDIRVVHVRNGQSEMILPPSDSHCLMLNLGSPQSLDVNLGKRNFEGNVRVGEVAIIPVGASWSCRSEGAHFRNVLLLYLRPLFVRSAASNIDVSYSEVSVTPQIGFRNNHIRHLAMSLLHELSEANAVGRLYADSLAIGLAIQLVRRYSSLNETQIGLGGMAPRRLRKAIGLIDHHLAVEEEGRIALRVIAKEVGMSYFHFSRAFKQTVGMNPTNYIAERRIERAKKLIEETDLPISEIALRSGFSSQSHFTTSFRRLAKVTPRSFRKHA